MDARQLRYFVAVAEEGSVTRAAARLGMQQPPLSQQIKALEKELAVELFRRHPRGVEVTAAGAALLMDARALLAGIESAARRTRRVARGAEGALVIGLSTSAASHRAAPETIAAFRARFPDVALSFIEGDAASLTEAVKEAKADVALIRAVVARPPRVSFQTVSEEPLVIALARSHRLAVEARRLKRPSIPLSSLRHERFILVRRAGAPGIYADLILACRRTGFEPQIAAEVRNMFINTTLVAAGVGVSVVPASMRESHSDLVAYFGIRSAARLSAPLTVVTHDDNANPAVARFCAVAKEIAARR